MEDQFEHSFQGRISRLRPIVPEDVPFVYAVSTCEENGFRWRYRGAFPDLANFSRDYNAGTLLQFVVVNPKTEERAGIVNIYGENLRDGWAYLGAMAAPEYRQTGIVIDGAATLMSYAFNLWAFRKIYIDTLEYNRINFEAGLKRIAIEEARLKGHVFFHGEYWDLTTSAVYRDDWRNLMDREPDITAADRTAPMSFEEFHVHLFSEFDVSGASRDSDLVADLGLDSLELAELASIACDLASEDQVQDYPSVSTLGDLYDWYFSHASER